MIKPSESKYASLDLDQRTWMMILTAARRKDKKAIEALMSKACLYYLAKVRNSDYIDRDDMILIRRQPYEVECPFCGKTYTIDMEALEMWGEGEENE